jgi:hypothetical protein
LLLRGRIAWHLVSLAALCWVFVFGQARASILTFDISTSSSGTAISNSSQIIPADVDYGDNITSATLASGFTDTNGHFYRYGAGNGPTPDITVDYATVRTSASSLVTYNGAPYDRAVYLNDNSTNIGAQLTFTPATGFESRVNSFDVQSDNGALQSGTWTVYAGSTSGPVLATGTWGTNSGALDTVDVSAAGAFAGAEVLQIVQTSGGPRDTGYDNVNFDQLAISAPEPASCLLLALGGMLGWTGRIQALRCKKRT